MAADAGRFRPWMTPSSGHRQHCRRSPRLERRVFDYSELEVAMTHLDQVLRQARRSLNAMTGRGRQQAWRRLV